MKRLIPFLLIITACNSTDKGTPTEQYYPISINKQIDNFSARFNANKISKTVFQDGTLERKEISIDQVLKDINSFKEFDINKPAWKNSYKASKSENHIRFETAENKLSLKYIDVYGAVENPSKICIYFQNNNNLYYSSKYIIWDLKHSYSIYSIQDVKGMDADTIFIKSTWN